MTPLPSIKQLRYLVALADHGHFGEAAEACFVTQSTLSAGIASLERLLAAPLVDRTTRSVVLTPLGRETADRARGILTQTEELALAARAAGAPLAGPLRLGVIPTVGPFLLPRLLPALRKAFPKLKLLLREDLTARLVDGLDTGALDLLLLALPCDCGTAETMDLFEDPFSLVARADHPLAAVDPVPVRRLAKEPLLLLQEGHCLREHALAACRLDEAKAPDGFEATSLLTLVQMADSGLGLTLVPRLALDSGILRHTGLVARPLAADSPPRRIGLAWRRGTRRAREFRLLGERIAGLARPARDGGESPLQTTTG